MKKTLYILQDGQLHRKDNSLYFESAKGRKFIPVENTNDICIFGNVRMSKRFLDFSSQKQVIIHYFDVDGKYISTYYPREYYNSGYTIVKQVEGYLNSDKRMILAKTIAEGYINQILKVINYYINRKTCNDKASLEDIQGFIEKTREKIIYENTIDGLNLIIKNVEKEYNKSFNFILNNVEFIDNENDDDIEYMRKVNLIQFGESVGQAIILSEIYKTHLDPRIGYFHDANSNSFPLCLDILYIFKPIMVHRLIFTLINKSIITKKDFGNYDGKVFLSREGKGKFIMEFDKRMRTTVKHRHLDRYVSYRRLIRLELYKIQKYILEGTKYEPYKALW